MREVQKTREEWQQELSSQQCFVLFEKGTERPFSHPYNDNKEEGTYVCAACGTPLFSSETKYDSGSGWPSFFMPVAKENVEEIVDKSHGMIRTEVVCRTCGGHLGHVFNDGPKPTGLRYCTNGAALKFHKAE
ncbi:peptide-methionine (R)-S-oxide reductase MsrB [Dyadobacter fermentans]|uniref:Peptide methionine sulfoxide reductase MsrB n=1 Tax=Dyadobacter fermentans (strain ATCC 700827 / DSM 18053 / CIP 107007 / KCTC 52180 / NS114) TaxID=471854 RepID=C6W5M7_DYAFD|nr:peptide-methionine (R)-S-oxide reductase MsrB [Dyadobacter fermentans]ACT95966.1 methionine-R-sulfoxide reductase [Dyadobacter fermentans DSM 18053]